MTVTKETKKARAHIVYNFFWVLGVAFLLAAGISALIAVVGMKQDILPLRELRNDLILAVFIACVQLLWVGAEKDNRTYVVRTIINFAALVGGSTLLMLWFGWLPPLGLPIVLYFVLFVGIYALIWVIIWKHNQKERDEMNRRLDEYKNDEEKQ